jgi:flavin reductase ActVB
MTNDLKERFKATMSQYPAGVVIVTTAGAAGLQGFTATSFSSLSLDPPSVLVCLARSALCYEAFVQSSHFVVNLIDAADADLATVFARRGADKFGSAPYRLTEHGVPVLEDCAAFVECRTSSHFVVGDHAVLVGTVAHTEARQDREVLVHYRRQFGRVTL